MTLKLDKATRAILGVSARSIKDLAFFGLNGRAIHQATAGFAQAESAVKNDKFGNPTGVQVGMIVDPAAFNGEVLTGHEKGGFHSPRVKERKQAIVKNGVVITHRELKGRNVSTGVYFPVDEFTPEETRVAADPNESVTCDRENAVFEPHRNRVNMNGTRVSHNRRPSKKRHQKRAA